MSGAATRLAAGIFLMLAASSCPGDGSRLADEMMGGGIQPTLQSIQDNVFSPICTECHVPGGPGPMPLDSAGVSFQNLVGAQSVEVMLKRVEPGDPEASYLVHKIEGRAGILGTRMPPPPRAMLSGEQIDAIRQWIVDGALP